MVIGKIHCVFSASQSKLLFFSVFQVFQIQS